jgi:hypothetical protein
LLGSSLRPFGQEEYEIFRRGRGAPKGNKNARNHGLYIREALEERRRLSKLMADARKTLKAPSWQPYAKER